MPISELRSESQDCTDVHSAWGESEGACIRIVSPNKDQQRIQQRVYIVRT